MQQLANPAFMEEVFLRWCHTICPPGFLGLNADKGKSGILFHPNTITQPFNC